MLRLGHFLSKVDPLADEVIVELLGRPRAEQEALVASMLSQAPSGLPPAMRRLHDSLRAVPYWFDLERANHGGALVLRGGLLSGFVLGFKSLVLGYCSPAGNKPLAMSGRLEADVHRRLGETGRFVEAVCSPQGLAWGGEGFVATVKVRLIHARVRHALLHAPTWQTADWGAPINQYDMSGTVLLFSSILLDGLESLGFSVTADDRDGLLHLWRYAGRLMGVDDELLCTNATEAAHLWAMLEQTQAAPDLDSRRLAHALILDGANRGLAPPAAVDFGYAVSRHLIGKRYADALGYPRSMWDVAPKVLRRVVTRLDSVAKRWPGGREQALRSGMAYWRNMVEVALGTDPVEFSLPERPLAERHRNQRPE